MLPATLLVEFYDESRKASLMTCILRKRLLDFADLGHAAHAGLGIVFAAILAPILSAQAPPPTETSRSPSLIVQPVSIPLGPLAPGRSARAAATLRNVGTEAVEVARFETSCPCVRVTPDRLRLAVGGTASIRVTFDPIGEPGLAVEYIGRSPDDAAVLRGTVRLEVKAPPKSPAVTSAGVREVTR